MTEPKKLVIVWDRWWWLYSFRSPGHHFRPHVSLDRQRLAIFKGERVVVIRWRHAYGAAQERQDV